VSLADTLDTAWTEVAREMSAARLWGGMCDRQAVEAGQGIGRLVGSSRLLLLLPPVT
jgi:hypothetical protein